jgi:hypothetical protein
MNGAQNSTLLPLLANERVLWTGSPDLAGTTLSDSVTRLVRSLLWLAIGLAALAPAIVFGSARGIGSNILAAIGVLILYLWIRLVVTSPITMRKALQQTHYTLTNRRVIITRDNGGRVLESSHFFDDTSIVEIRPRETKSITESRGTIYLSGGETLTSIPDARRVYELLVVAVAGARNAESK